jgi:metal transporter CNNM
MLIEHRHELEHALSLELGGPSRYLAANYGCRVSGVDLRPTFVESGNLSGRARRALAQSSDGSIETANALQATLQASDRTARAEKVHSMSYIPTIWIWLGIIACITLSALFAGLNLAIFSLSQLRLQIEADGGNKDAARVLDLRKDSNQVLATVIWGNVGSNVFLTLLSDSALAGVGAFFFSAFVITLFAEIAPQAYFARNALRMTARFLPFLIFWRATLFVLARPTAILLDRWLGVEGIAYLRERDVRSLVARAAVSGGDIGELEATGVQNFLDLDDLRVTEEGEPVHAQSIISLPLAGGRCVLPAFEPSPDDPFLQRVNASGKKWVIVTDLDGEPAFVLDSHHFLRDALFNQPHKNQGACWHRPVIVRDMQTQLGDVIGCLKVVQERPDDDVIDDDLILVWGSQRRIITGSDLLGRLLRGIANVEAENAARQSGVP